MPSNVCFGFVRHRRYAPKKNNLRYKVFMMYVDLLRMQEDFKPYWLWSIDRMNIARFQRKKYLGNPCQSLFLSVQQRVVEELGICPDNVFLLTNFAYYGYCINPISVYFCFERGELVAFVLEVTNTPWKEQCCYVLPAVAIKPGVYTARFQKKMHVSPFLGMDYVYDMRVKFEEGKIIVHIRNLFDNVCHMDATLSLDVRGLSSGNLARALVSYPFMTTKVVLAIHWQALKLWFKRVRYFPKGGK